MMESPTLQVHFFQEPLFFYFYQFIIKENSFSRSPLFFTFINLSLNKENSLLTNMHDIEIIAVQILYFFL